MPSKKQYNLVNDDAYDCRIPLYNEEAFQHGISFHAKYIGSLDVPRPTSRVEIVAAMRRIRAKSVKKKKVSMTISVDGVKVVIRSKRKSSQWPWDDNKLVVMHHPIYRIFYVSHDSQDLKIFSYIARDGGTNAFKCNVFKSKKKSQAMRIVRTVGQAFEVCHKLSLALAASSNAGSPIMYDIEDSQFSEHLHKGDGASEPNSCDTQPEDIITKQQEIVAPPIVEERDNALPKRPTEPLKFGPGANLDSAISENVSLNFVQQIQTLKSQLEEQNEQIQLVNSQLRMLKDQLNAETAARLQMQAENQQLNAYNRELLEQITKLIHHFHEMERRQHHSDGTSDTKLLLEPLPFPKMASSSHLNSSPSDSDGTRKKCIGGRSVPDGFSTTALQCLEQEGSMSQSNHVGRSALSVTHPSFSEGNRNSTNIGSSLPGSPSQRHFTIDSDSVLISQSPLTMHQNSQKPNLNYSAQGHDYPNYFHESVSNSGNFAKNSASDYSRYLTTLPSVRDDKKNNFPFSTTPSSVDPFRHEGGLKMSCNNSKQESCESRYAQDKTKYYPAINEKAANPQSPQNSCQVNSLPHDNHIANLPTKNDSFIAQVARDLAKMNVADRGPPLYS